MGVDEVSYGGRRFRGCDRDRSMWKAVTVGEVGGSRFENWKKRPSPSSRFRR